MKHSKALVALGLGGLALFVLTGSRKAEAHSAPVLQDPIGYDPNAMPELIMANFPQPQAQAAPSASPQQIQPEVHPYSVPVPKHPTGFVPQPAITTGETPIVAPPIASAPTVAADDTVALARLLLADEASGNWKKKYPQVATWQASRNLKADKLFGPVTALKMAEELGTIPLVRYWPKSSQQGPAVNTYRDMLEVIASHADEPRRTQLHAASAREQGQGFAAKPGRPKTVISI